MRWASARSRHDGSPTDTQADTKSRTLHQGTVDHCLKSRRRHYEEGSGISTVSFRELHEWVLIVTCKQLVWSTRIGRNMPIWILCILETKTKVGNTVAKTPSHVPTQTSMRHQPYPNHTPIHHTKKECVSVPRPENFGLSNPQFTRVFVKFFVLYFQTVTVEGSTCLTYTGLYVFIINR